MQTYILLYVKMEILTNNGLLSIEKIECVSLVTTMRKGEPMNMFSYGQLLLLL